MPEIDLELKNILEETNQERAIRKGHPVKENLPHSDKMKKLEAARKIIGQESNSITSPTVRFCLLMLG